MISMYSTCAFRYSRHRVRHSVVSFSGITNTTPPLLDDDTDNNNTKPRPRYNRGLESIKEQGETMIEATLKDIQSKTKQHLLIEDEDHGPTVYQIKEALKLRGLMEEALENAMSRHGNIFCIMNEPIAIIDVEITEDLRQARVFWSLPYALLMMGDHKINRETREELARRMQAILDERGGILYGYVHSRLRSYFRPPKIRFVKAEGEMLRQSLQEIS